MTSVVVSRRSHCAHYRQTPVHDVRGAAKGVVTVTLEVGASACWNVVAFSVVQALFLYNVLLCSSALLAMDAVFHHDHHDLL